MDSTDIQIQEGFLCPYCIVRFDGDDQLWAHLSEHEEGSIKNEVFLPFKGFFDKARQKLSKLESFIDQPSDIFTVKYEPPIFVDQKIEEEKPELGPITSHSSYFNKERNSRVDDVAVETNKLIIRLDKLITEMPSEPSKRKAFEQEVIPWLSDSESQQCNLCGAKFSLTKRKHHCRLCGKILCSSCSKFLTFTYARKLVNPAYAVMYQVEIDSLKKQQQQQSEAGQSSSADPKSNPYSTSNLNLRNAERFLMSGFSKLKQQKDGSEEGDDHIRVCRYCNDLLEKRDQQVEQRTKTPMIVQIYERLFTLIVEVDRLFQSYCTISRSLSYGESKYELQMARDLRVKIVRLQEQIDYVCKKLGAVNNENSELSEESQSQSKTPKTSTTSRESVLLQNVQRFTYEFLRDMALSMPNLPDNEEYAKLQLAQKMSMETKIQNERAFAAAVAVQTSAGSSSIKNATQSGHSLSPPSSSSQHQRLYRPSENTGSWAPSKTALTSSISSFAVNPFDEQKSIDPVEEQIIYIQALIRQAATDGRTEIVETLSKNLNELKEELLIRKQTGETENAPADT